MLSSSPRHSAVGVVLATGRGGVTVDTVDKEATVIAAVTTVTIVTAATVIAAVRVDLNEEY